jgi:predicted  nucleic acid-binding Zn-ribbon protein
MSWTCLKCGVVIDSGTETLCWKCKPAETSQYVQSPTESTEIAPPADGLHEENAKWIALAEGREFPIWNLAVALARTDEKLKAYEEELDAERLRRCESVTASGKHTKEFMQEHIVKPLEADRGRLARENEELRKVMQAALDAHPFDGRWRKDHQAALAGVKGERK